MITFELPYFAAARMMLLLAILVIGAMRDVVGKPAFSPVYVDDRAQNYLMKFGYLPQSDLETGNLRTDDQLKDAIRSLQRFGGIAETGIVDAATQRLMVSRRCGLPDKPDLRLRDERSLVRHKRYTLHGTPWKHLNLTWSLRTENPSGLETGSVRRELSRALKLWQKNSKLTFQEINSESADILIYFHRGYHGDGYPFDGRGQILAHAFFPGSDRGGDAHFDEDEQWTLGDSSLDDGTSLFAVAAHEFGHSLGLAHSSVRGALMYPWYQGITEDYELPEDDKHGIQQMYGAPDKLWGKNPDYPHYRPRPPPTTTTTTTTTTTERPWRTRPPYTPPSHNPRDRPYTPRDHPHRPNHYPPDERPRRPEYPPERRPDDRPRQPSYPPERRPDERPPRRPDDRPRQPYYPPSTPSTPRRPPYHRPHHHHPNTVGTTPPTRYRPIVKKDVPDKCDTDYDAISLIRRELFVFKGRYVWRLNERGLMEGFPAEIIHLFKFPMEVDHVDAVYERTDNNRIVFFIGRNYYVFDAFNLVPGYPRPITDLGLPPDLEKIDAAMVWGYNKMTYFFSGNMYWRFDEKENYVELDYPRDISMFAGIGTDIDAAFQWKNGTTYFFKGKNFWQFDDMRMRVAHKRPKPSAIYWMHCPRGIETNEVDFDYPTKSRIHSISASTSTSTNSCLVVVLLMISIRRLYS